MCVYLDMWRGVEFEISEALGFLFGFSLLDDGQVDIFRGQMVTSNLI